MACMIFISLDALDSGVKILVRGLFVLDPPLALITNLPDRVLNTFLYSFQHPKKIAIFAGTQMIFGLIMHMALVYTKKKKEEAQ